MKSLGQGFFIFAMVVLNMVNLCIHVALLGILLMDTFISISFVCIALFLLFCILVYLHSYFQCARSFFKPSTFHSFFVCDTRTSCKGGHHWLMY